MALGEICKKCGNLIYDKRCHTCKPIEDNINHPRHYQIGEYEVINIIEAWCKEAGANLTAKQLYNFASAIKYLLRAPFKGCMVQDLKKCAFHIERTIKLLEKK